ncbi:MAG: MtrB/PioB family outer membrane beta-barrel protein [Thermoanaerobaculia bacterium]
MAGCRTRSRRGTAAPRPPRARRRSPSTRAIDTWEVACDEENDTWGLGLTSRFAEDWKADVSGRWTRSDGFADFLAFPGGLALGTTRSEAADFGNYEDIELLALDGRLEYRLGPRTTAGFTYRYEDYTIDSFILQDLRNYLPGALLLDGENGDYQADLFLLDLRLAF